MSGPVKKVTDVVFKAGKNIDWDGMAKLLVSDEARKEFNNLRRAFDEVNSQLQTKFSQVRSFLPDPHGSLSFPPDCCDFSCLIDRLVFRVRICPLLLDRLASSGTKNKIDYRFRSIYAILYVIPLSIRKLEFVRVMSIACFRVASYSVIMMLEIREVVLEVIVE